MSFGGPIGAIGANNQKKGFSGGGFSGNQKSNSANKALTSGIQTGILPTLTKMQSKVTGSGEANQLSHMSAQQAMAFSREEAAALRDWQQNMWQQTSAFNAAEAQKNRDWQEQMSNTAYQRAMADMRAAGLNPILAYTQGGASTPGGSSASMGTMSGAMGTGYAYQGVQEASAGLKIFDFISETAQDALNNFAAAMKESDSFKKWVKGLMK